jgi:SAM-dependent methyltransferase
MTATADLATYRAAWQAKPVLREIYEDFYRRMASACRPGRTLEIGGGSGNFKAFYPGVVSTDIQFSTWLDAVCDAHRLPFADGAFDNIVMVDVLHHLHRPRRFLAEASRVLKPAGRLVLVEPAVTPISWLFYRFVHPEWLSMREDPLAEGEVDPTRDPYDANQAIPTLLFRGHGPARLKAIFPEFLIRSCRLFSLFAYPMSGGFRRWSLIPAAAVAPLLRLEAALAPLLGPLMAFRLFAVVERR